MGALKEDLANIIKRLEARSGKHLVRLSAPILYEENKENEKMNEISESVIKRTSNQNMEKLSQGMLEQKRIFDLMRQYNISESVARNLYLQKLSREFEITEDNEITVKKIEEKW